MSVILILLGVLVALFVGAFFSKRRFGVLGLGLTAGAIISPLCGEDAGYLVSVTGLVPEGPLVNMVAASVIILVPAILFMFNGYRYKYIVERVIGSLLFTVLAAAFLVAPIGSVVALTGPVGAVYDWIIQNRASIISIGVVLVVVDFLFARTPQKPEKKRR
jgi:hypothetical protein